MDKLKFRYWTWPENPETFLIDAVMEPLYTIADDGTISYQGLGPLCRVITGKGVFHGPDANNAFNALSVMMAGGKDGDLIHPVWGTIKAYLVGLKMEEGSRDEYIAYSFTFRECDESGMIPPLPEYQPDNNP